MKYLVRSFALTACLGLQALATAPAFAAGPYADELSKCLVRSTTSTDKTLLVQWMFATAALHPDVKWLATVSDSQRAELNKKTARLFEGLLTSSCLAETREALKYEGGGTIESSFNVLGQVAARELFANPSVAKGLAELGKFFDEEAIRKALKSSK
jgi:hypothetical protein